MATRLLMLLVRLPAAPTGLLMAGIVGGAQSAFLESEQKTEGSEKKRWR